MKLGSFYSDYKDNTAKIIPVFENAGYTVAYEGQNSNTIIILEETDVESNN